MVIIAKESFNAYGKNKLMLHSGSIADIPDDLANQLIKEGKAFRYSFENGIDYDYVPGEINRYFYIWDESQEKFVLIEDTSEVFDFIILMNGFVIFDTKKVEGYDWEEALLRKTYPISISSSYFTLVQETDPETMPSDWCIYGFMPISEDPPRETELPITILLDSSDTINMNAIIHPWYPTGYPGDIVYYESEIGSSVFVKIFEPISGEEIDPVNITATSGDTDVVTCSRASDDQYNITIGEGEVDSFVLIPTGVGETTITYTDGTLTLSTRFIVLPGEAEDD